MKIKLLPLFLIILLVQCKQNPKITIRDDFKKYYDEYKVVGTFALFDQNENIYTLYNKSQFEKQFIPASTFKICNSLIGLETGVIKDEYFVIKWDSIMRPVGVWNRDHDMQSAFQNSVVWYYQEVARRIGGKRMKFWLDKVGYGNADTAGGIDRFWLTGKLRITPKQQIEFLQRLYKNELPFSQRSMDIVKKVMIVEDTLGYVLRAKTGWSSQDGYEVGWYVGYLEKNGNVYYFANCVQTTDTNNLDFPKSRILITRSILNDLGIIKQ